MPRAGSVVFDCDSTLSALEGIDELAAAHRDEVARLTDAVMRGEIALEDVYAKRLELAGPSREAVRDLGRRYIQAMVPDAREVVAALRKEGIEVRIISGGLTPAVRALARTLGLGDEAVAAVDVYFDQDGHYAGFDAGSPLTRSGGKKIILEQWAPHLPRPIVLVGDGATDLEARPPADLFVAFAGVIERPAVTAAADIVVRSPSLAPVLAIALDGSTPRDEASRAILETGRALLETR